MQKTVVIYSRVSSKEQEREGFSIPAQIKLLKEYATKNSLKISSEFVEAETAKKSGRTQFNEMIKFLKKNKSINTILVEKTDRLYRNLKDYVLLDEIEGLEIHFVKEGTILSEKSRSQDKFMHGIRVLMAKNYIDNLSEEIKKGLNEKAEQGFCPTKAPFGYKNLIEKDGRRIIVSDKETIPFIIKAFELYATGCYSFDKVAKVLAQDGFVANGKPCTHKVVERILHNPFYIGMFKYKGNVYRNAQHEAIVSPELYLTVQNRLNEVGKSKPQINEFPYLGLIKCAKCGCAITAEIKKGKYIYYHCTGRKGGDCKKIYVKQEAIEKSFENLIKQIDLKPPEIEEIIEMAKDTIQLESNYTDFKAKQLDDKIKRYRQRISKLYTDRVDGIIPDSVFFEKNSEWQYELDKALIEYEIVNKANRTFMISLEKILDICKDAHAAFLVQNGKEKAQFLKIICSNFLFDGSNIVYTVNKPFNSLILSQKSKKLETVGVEPTSKMD